MRWSNVKKAVRETLTRLANEGLRTYIVDNEDSCYGFVVTNLNNLLVVDEKYGGCSFYLCYPPQTNCGDGCVCNEHPLRWDCICKKVIGDLEQDGLRNAAKFHVQKLYSDPEKEYLGKKYTKQELEEIKSV